MKNNLVRGTNPYKGFICENCKRIVQIKQLANGFKQKSLGKRLTVFDDDNDCTFNVEFHDWKKSMNPILRKCDGGTYYCTDCGRCYLPHSAGYFNVTHISAEKMVEIFKADPEKAKVLFMEASNFMVRVRKRVLGQEKSIRR